MCRPKILPAGERKAVIKDIFDPVYFREARIYNLDHKEKNPLSQTISPWEVTARALCAYGRKQWRKDHISPCGRSVSDNGADRALCACFIL